jgi:putative oxidoreductase
MTFMTPFAASHSCGLTTTAPIASIPMAIVLLVAIFTVHVPNGFSSIKLQSVDATGAHFGQRGYETDLLYTAGLFAIAFGGSGRLALDSVLQRRVDLMERQQDDASHTELAGNEEWEWPLVPIP